ncbi:MAG: aminotransferase class IV [Wenzhouxiangella sp.]
MSYLVDGQPADALPCNDRGFLYGEGVFETIAFQNRQAPLWAQHMDRLQRSAAALVLDDPGPAVLFEDCQRLLPEQGRYIVRLSLSAGSGGQGYWRAADQATRRVLSRREWPASIDQHRRDGLRLGLSSITVPKAMDFQGIKHANRLLQVAAARECQAKGDDEAVLLDPDGAIVEAISSNIVLVRDGALHFHPQPAVAGVGLDWLRRHADLQWLAQPLTCPNLAECSEVLVINSIGGVRPAIEVAGQQFAVGPICRQLQSLWDAQLI